MLIQKAILAFEQGTATFLPDSSALLYVAIVFQLCIDGATLNRTQRLQ